MTLTLAGIFVVMTTAMGGQDVESAVTPADMTIEQLEEEFGENLFTEDPAGTGSPDGSPDDAVLHRWFGTAPPGALNALLKNDANLVDSLLIYTTLNPGLAHRDDPDLWKPGVADFAAVSDDRLTVTVRLKKGIHWQFPAVDREDSRYAWLVKMYEDGAPELTAADFKFTLETILNPDTAAGYLRGYYDGLSIDVLDRYTYQLKCEKFNYDSPGLALSWLQVLPEFLYTRDETGRVFGDEEFGKAFNEHWHMNLICGYGPYRFVKMDPGVEIVLERIDDFPVFHPGVKEIHWQIVRDGEQCILRMLDGEMDYTVFMPNQFRKYVINADEEAPFRDGSFTLKPYDKIEYAYLAWNCRRPPFDDARVRRAMALAFNREGILEHVFDGFGSLVEGPVFAKHPHYNDSMVPHDFDLEKASTLLDEAGWSDEDGDGIRDRVIDGKKVDFSFTMIHFGSSSEYEAAMAIYRDDLRRIGVEMTPEPLAWRVMYQRCYVDQDFDAFTGLTVAGWAIDFAHRFHSDQITEGSNFVAFRNDEIDELSVRYRETADSEERRLMARRIQEILHEEQPYTFFMRRYRMSAYRPWIQNVFYAVSRPQLASYGWFGNP